MKRALMRKRAPLPQASGPVVGAAPLPSVVEPTTTTTERDRHSTTSTSTSSSASVSTVIILLSQV
jgi:hypothetical protein